MYVYMSVCVCVFCFVWLGQEREERYVDSSAASIELSTNSIKIRSILSYCVAIALSSNAAFGTFS